MRHTVTALLRDEVGFEREHVVLTDEGEDYDAGLCEFMWTDGNNACDCNRSAFLYMDPAKALPCSSLREGAGIRLVSLKFDGVEIYAE